MADIETYTCGPCGPTGGETYEISVIDALGIPSGNLAAVRVADNPVQHICCGVDRSTSNKTPEEDVKPAVDSGFTTSECTQCMDHWS